MVIYTIGRHRENSKIFTIELGDTTSCYKHPHSPFSLVSCSRNLFSGSLPEDLSFPITISLLDEPTDKSDSYKQLYAKCEELENCPANISSEPLILPKHQHSAVPWYKLPPTVQPEDQVPLKIATTDDNQVWILSDTVKPDSIYSHLSNVKCLSLKHRVSKADFQWLEEVGFSHQDRPWCLDCLQTQAGMSDTLHKKLFDICSTAPNRTCKTPKHLKYEIPK